MSECDQIYELIKQLLNTAFPNNKPSRLSCDIFCGEKLCIIQATKDEHGEVSASILDV